MSDPSGGVSTSQPLHARLVGPASHEESWSLDCISCGTELRASTRSLLLGLLDSHAAHTTADDYSVSYLITTEAVEGRAASRPHIMWMTLPTLLLRGRLPSPRNPQDADEPSGDQPPGCESARSDMRSG